MKENLFVKILRMEKKKQYIIVNRGIDKTRILPKRNMSAVIPEEYCIEVITTIPERKKMIEMIEI